MNEDKYFLSWNSFSTHLVCTFKDLITERHFADVTLVSDDEIQIKAHKIVLSACSPVLKELLLEHPQSQPLLYLSGVKHKQLESILQFMYSGEVIVLKEDIEEFLKIGMDLEMKELFIFQGGPGDSLEHVDNSIVETNKYDDNTTALFQIRINFD